MTALIISGGEYAPLPDVPYDQIIACDRGYLHARRMGIRPDLIIGDFDSAPVPENDVPIERYPAHKDDTDTMLAVKKALRSDCDEILIACAFGGRLDHTMANIQAGAYVAEHGGTARLFGIGTEAVVFKDGLLTFPRHENCSLSVFSISETSVISVSGAEYSGDRISLSASFPLGVSNAWADDEITVTAHGGIILVMMCDLTGD